MGRGTLIYYANKKVYFNEDHLVFRSVHQYDLPPTHDICFEWKIFGLTPEVQPRLMLLDVVKTLSHPFDCVLDIEATIAYLKYRYLDKSLVQNWNERNEYDQRLTNKRK